MSLLAGRGVRGRVAATSRRLGALAMDTIAAALNSRHPLCLRCTSPASTPVVSKADALPANRERRKRDPVDTIRHFGPERSPSRAASPSTARLRVCHRQGSKHVYRVELGRAPPAWDMYASDLLRAVGNLWDHEVCVHSRPEATWEKARHDQLDRLTRRFRGSCGDGCFRS